MSTQGPTGSRVRIDELNVNTMRTRSCWLDWVLVNGESQMDFPPESSEIFCGRRTVTTLPTSSSELMLLAYRGSRRRSRGIEFTYTIVEAASDVGKVIV